jgi:hypothetical protein
MNKMKQVVIFNESSTNQLQNRINEWIAGNQKYYRTLDIKYSSYGGRSDEHFTALIIYEKKVSN